MPMLVVGVVPVEVVMTQPIMPVCMGMTLRDMQPDTDCHQQRRGPEQATRPFPEHGHGGRCPEERRNGEVGTRTGGPEVAQCPYEQAQANPIAK
jgi:hypothetical protein